MTAGDTYVEEAAFIAGVADSYLVYTGYTDGYSNVFIPGNEYFRFQVRACHDVTVALSAVPGVTGRQTYEVLIGGAQVGHKLEYHKTKLLNEFHLRCYTYSILRNNKITFRYV